MQDYLIDVGKVEELQMISDLQELDIIFQKAKSAIVCGAVVHLVRQSTDGTKTPFDHFTTLPDLSAYRKTVYKYLKTE